jgi:ribosomal peptide maturation radical SAM protein 1
MKTLLVCMPFGDLRRPALSLSTLKGSMQRAGLECDIAYLNLAYAAVIGEGAYRSIAERIPPLALAGEWVFAEALRGEGQSAWPEYEDQVLRPLMHVPLDVAETLQMARDRVGPFLADAFASIQWADYDVVGFTSFGAQNAGSLALSRLVKEHYPRIVIVFGGHNWWGAAGEAFHRHFPWVDAAFTGEADASLIEMLEAMRGRRDARNIPGVVSRGGGNERRTLPARPILHLDGLPCPEHEDYFAWRERTGARIEEPVIVPVELSRGCWWSAKGPCTFCGLNGERRVYRAKSAARMMADILAAAATGDGHVEIVDNVVPRRFLDDVLPQLAHGPRLPGLSFKVRPDVGRRDVKNAAAAGASITCGIESLSDRLLGLLCKGVGDDDVLAVLRWASEQGLPVRWNLLWGLPGERPEDYETQLGAIEGLKECSPPRAVTPIILERGSALWREAEQRGYGKPRPARAYSHVYDLEARDLEEVAYFHEHDYLPGLRTLLAIERLAAGVDRWKAARS